MEMSKKRKAVEQGGREPKRQKSEEREQCWLTGRPRALTKDDCFCGEDFCEGNGRERCASCGVVRHEHFCIHRCGGAENDCSIGCGKRFCYDCLKTHAKKCEKGELGALTAVEEAGLEWDVQIYWLKDAEA